MIAVYLQSKGKIDDCHIVQIKLKLAAAKQKGKIVETGNTINSSDEESDVMVSEKPKDD